MADKPKNASKMKISHFRPQVVMDKATAQKTWKQLAESFEEIYSKNNSKLYYEEVYRLSYTLVLRKHGDLLYKGVQDTFQTHTTKTFHSLAAEPDENLLPAILTAWQDHRTTTEMIKDVVQYLEKAHILHKKLTPIYDMGVLIFRQTIVYSSSIRERLRRMLLENLANERRGEIIDTGVVGGILSMLIELGLDGEKVYENEFETPFLSSTRSFYREESLLFISQNTCPDYIRKVEDRLAQETKRIATYLAKTTEQKLKKIAESELISAHAQTLVDMEHSGCESMFRDNRLQDLAALFRLFSRVPQCLDFLRDAMTKYVKSTGSELIADHDKSREPPVVFAQKLLDLKAKFNDISSTCFQSEPRSVKLLKEAFEEFMNKDNRTAAYVAMYADDLLKTGLKGVTEGEAEDRLDQIIVIFRHIHDKDVFESYYKNFLAKRLLSGKGIQDELERFMLSKLKTECGYQFTSKLEGMFTDVHLSRGVNDKYQEYLRNMGSHSQQQQSQLQLLPHMQKPAMDFEVNVLTAGFWPSTAPAEVHLPDVVTKDCVNPFMGHYLSCHSGRKLSWQYHLGSAELKCNFAEGKRELNVSTYQMCILMLFNQADALSLAAIREQTGIPESDLRRHLLSLCTPKFRILNKSSTSKTVKDGDVFTFNALFTSKLRRVKIPLVVLKDGGGSGSCNGGGSGGGGGGGYADMVLGDGLGGVPAAVEEDRRHMVEATIVRIMKARKTLGHNELVAEAMRQCAHRFTPDAQSVKKRIESLIEREYLQRDANDRKKYNYLA